MIKWIVTVVAFPIAVGYYLLEVAAEFINSFIENVFEGTAKAFEFTETWPMPNRSKYDLR